MNEQTQLIVETTERILTDLCTQQRVEDSEQGVWAADLWNTLEENGLTLAAVGAEQGGAGGTLVDSMAIIKCAARHAAPLPLLETLIAGLMLEACGQTVPQGPMVACVGANDFELSVLEKGFTLTGSVRCMPWLPRSSRFLIVTECEKKTYLVQLKPDRVVQREFTNMAGEPVSDVNCEAVTLTGDEVHALPNNWTEPYVYQLFALGKAVMICGALESILDLSVQYAQERVQFGRTISKFQAIQHDLAILAGHVAASASAVDSATESILQGNAELDVAAAKSRTGEAAGMVARIAHQVTGAMGYTREHQLNLRTRRVWVWRDEFGNEGFWQDRIGSQLCQAEADNLWSTMIGM